MRVLFVCKGNVGRSQMAEALFDKFSKDKDLNYEVRSAGTHVLENEGIKIRDIEKANFVWEVMDEEEIDVRDRERNQVSEELVNWADKVVMMTEKENWPNYIEENRDKLVIWIIDDPKGTDLDFHRKTRDQIKKLTEDLATKEA